MDERDVVANDDQVESAEPAAATALREMCAHAAGVVASPAWSSLTIHGASGELVAWALLNGGQRRELHEAEQPFWYVKLGLHGVDVTLYGEDWKL